MTTTREQVVAAIRQHGNWLHNQGGVRGLYDGADSQGNPCLVVLCSSTPEETKQAIRAQVQVPVRFEEGVKIELYKQET